MSDNPKILSSRFIAKTKCFRVEELELRFANGEERTYERMSGYHDAVMIVPMLNDDTVLLIREYGAGIDRYCLGLPKGAVDAGEDILAAANRELKEEVGYGARDMTLIKRMISSPAYSSKAMYLALARDLYEERLQGDEPEPIEVVPWSLKNLSELVARDDVQEARTIAALYMVRELLHG